MEGRLDVRKTYKLFIGGAFPRSESGRTFAVADADRFRLRDSMRADALARAGMGPFKPGGAA